MGSKLYKHECQYCGAKIVSTMQTLKMPMCADCTKKRKAVYNLFNARVMRGKITRQACRDLTEQKMHEYGSEKAAAGNVIDEVEEYKPLPHPVRCKFCGKKTVHPSGFCKTCRDERLDCVYEVTGRSNGWDRPMSARGSWRISLAHKKYGDAPNAVEVSNHRKEGHHAD